MAVATLLTLALALSGAEPLPTLAEFGATPAVTGFEQALLDEIEALLPPGTHATRDSLGSLVVRSGPADGPVERLVLVGVDEPGYVVSQIREDGYLRVRTVGTRTTGDFHLWAEGRPAVVHTRHGPRPGVLLVDSIHLRGDRPEAFGEAQQYLDVGADDAREAAGLGIELLDAVSLREVVVFERGHRAGPAMGRRAAALAMLRVLHELQGEPTEGLAFAFVAQSLVGRGDPNRGVEAVLTQLQPTDVVELTAGSVEDGLVERSEQHPRVERSWFVLTLAAEHLGTPVETVTEQSVGELAGALYQELHQ
jgi:putative aminopeptidase FrvX